MADHYFVKCGCSCQCEMLIAAEYLDVVIRFNSKEEVKIICWRCQNDRHSSR